MSQPQLYFSKPTTNREARHLLSRWEMDLNEFEAKYPRELVSEVAKKLALKSIMPEWLFGEQGIFRAPP